MSMTKKGRHAEVAFRVLFSLPFVIAGAGHLVRPTGFVERLLESPIGRFVAALAPPGLLVAVTGVVLLVAVLLGGLVHFAALGAGGCSVDHRRRSSAGTAGGLA